MVSTDALHRTSRCWASVAGSWHALDNGADDPHAGHPHDIRDRVLQLHVHLHQGLLHQLNVRRRRIDEPLAVPQDRPQPQKALVRTEAAAEQTILVELLEPLRVIDVRFPPWDMLHVARIHEEDLEPPRLEDLEDGNPVNARRFHGDGRDADGVQPVGQTTEIAGKAPERPDGLIAHLGRDGDHMKRRAHIQTSGVGVHDAHRRGFGGTR